VDIDYGTYFTSSPHRPDDITLDGRVTTTCRRRAFLVSKSPNFHNWSWDRDHKVHFVCHSQGGNTVRFLIGLMANGARGWHPEYFSEAGRDDWTISVTTLGTPHRGTTVVDVLESFLSVCLLKPSAPRIVKVSLEKANEKRRDQDSRPPAWSQDSSLHHPFIFQQGGLMTSNSTTGESAEMQGKHSSKCSPAWKHRTARCGSG
jgi:hypothetical protein